MTAPGGAQRRLAAPELERTGRRERTSVEHGATDPGEPSFLARQREQRPWLDHLVRAGGRFTDNKGDYFAAGITYYTVLALVPIVMVAFAAFGFVLAGNQDLLNQVQDKVATSAPASFRTITQDLVKAAVTKKNSVGIIGLVLALYSGLGWMSNIREALTAQWEQHENTQSFVKKKGGDLLALLGLGAALILSVVLSAVGGTGTGFVLDLVNLQAVPGAFLVTRVIAIALSIGASWLIFIWVIARLPREPVPTRSAVKAALLAAVVFEVFKQVAGIYLKSVTGGPAGSAFGPIIGLLVFVFFTSRVLIFATAWAATTQESLDQASVPVPGPAVVTTQVRVGGGTGPGGALALVGMGAAAALGLTWRRRKR